MNSKFNLNNANVDVLLKVVASKLKMKPEVLKKQLEEGKFDEALKNMSPKDAVKFQQVIKNPALAEKMMTSPQARELYEKAVGKKP